MICDATNSKVLENEAGRHLECDDSIKKTVTIDTGNLFSIDLFSGIYFMEIQSDDSKFAPVRISVHKGQTGKTQWILDY